MVEFNFGKIEKICLCITNYQFPEAGRECFNYDRNWLNVSISVQTRAGSWQSNDPCLLTWELKMIIDEFRNIEFQGLSRKKTISFIEPNLIFNLFPSTNNNIQMRINFDAESKPDSFQDDQDCFIEGWVSLKDLSRIADSFQHELDKFPERESDW